MITTEEKLKNSGEKRKWKNRKTPGKKLKEERERKQKNLG